MTRTYPSGALNFESFPALTKMPCSTCYFELSSFWKPERMQIEQLKYANLLTMYLKDVCEFLVHAFNMKWPVGATERWADTG